MPQTTTISRPQFKFKFPDKVRQYATDPKSITMRPITAAEERRANEVSEGAKTPLVFELVRVAVCEVDDKLIDWNTTDPEWLERCSPKVRQLVFEAFSRVNRPTDEDTQSFLDSQEIISAD